MAQTWNYIFRQVILRGNLLASENPTVLQSNYTVPAIGQSQMLGNATEFPKEAVDDCIVNASDLLVGAIAADENSPYRGFFGSDSPNITNGSTIPLVSASGKPRIGVVGSIRDSSTNKKLKFKDFDSIANLENIDSLQEIYWCYTDNVRLWHTRENVIADIIEWDKDSVYAALASTPRGTIPFPGDLHESLVCGALSFLFRNNFNVEQVDRWRQYFNQTLQRVSTKYKDFLIKKEIID